VEGELNPAMRDMLITNLPGNATGTIGAPSGDPSRWSMALAIGRWLRPV